MRQIILTIAVIFAAGLCSGQQINKAEYFVDIDPGFGMGVQIPVTIPGKDLSLSFQVDAGGLAQGFHMIVIRARDDKGKWSSSQQQVFYVHHLEGSTVSKIQKAEYFIDIDPGFGKGLAIPIAIPGTEMTLSFQVDPRALTEGFHMLVLRIEDELGRWSNVIQQSFYVHKIISTATSIISKAEYFVDIDPGFGLAAPITISTPGKNISMTFEINLSALNQGFHILVIRACDDSGRWSMSTQQVFYVFSTESFSEAYITGLEYYIDNDPGFGKGKQVPVATPGRSVSVDFTVDLDGVSDGDHVLYVRAVDEDGRWSHNSATAFSVLITGVGNMEVTSWLRVYPNPNEGNFTLEFGELPEGSINVTLKDLSGRIVYSNKLSGERIHLNLDLSGGIYFITIETGKKIFNQRIVIER